ncbi:unnamed protein product, partial [Ectocarpus fasciculatus]
GGSIEGADDGELQGRRGRVRGAERGDVLAQAWATARGKADLRFRRRFRVPGSERLLHGNAQGIRALGPPRTGGTLGAHREQTRRPAQRRRRRQWWQGSRLREQRGWVWGARLNPFFRRVGDGGGGLRLS